MRPVISLRNVSKSYRSGNGETTVVLRSVNLDVLPGTFTVIRGESGSGKTSLLRILGLLDGSFEGSYVFAGEDIGQGSDWLIDELRANNFGFIFQEGRLLDHLRIKDNIGMPVRLRGNVGDRKAFGPKLVKLARGFFTAEELDEKHILSSRPGQVSGGQKQRAAILRSIINRPAVILADEPTASLDEERKQQVLDYLMDFTRAGHTVIVVSHDRVFYGVGRQLELRHGTLNEIAVDQPWSRQVLPVRPAASGSRILFGWLPRAPLGMLFSQAVREAILRPIFLSLVLVSLWVGVSQVGVFSSVIVGAQAFLDDAMMKGSRLNRLEISPRTLDRSKEERFPVIGEIKASNGVQHVVPRRATLLRVVDAKGERLVYSAMGLHPDDPEYRLLDFVAGGPFSPEGSDLEIILTAATLPDVFTDATGLADGSKTFADFIGRRVVVEIPQFSATGEELKARSRQVKLKLQGLILHAEGGRQAYLPNTTQLAFDRFKMDRTGALELPVNADADTWTDAEAVKAMAAFPWEDQLQVYTKEMRDIIPVFQQLTRLGYKPRSDIWNYKWVLDLRDLAWNIFVPLLGLIVTAVSLTVITNLFTSAKMREREFALWRVLGMRRGDLVLSQMLSTVLVVSLGAGLGLASAALLVKQARSFLADQNPGAGFEAVFAPVEQFYLPIFVCSIVIGILAAIHPATRTAHVDPAKVLQS